MLAALLWCWLLFGACVCWMMVGAMVWGILLYLVWFGLRGLLLALVPVSGLDLGYLGCAAGVSFGCVDSMLWIGVA